MAFFDELKEKVAKTALSVTNKTKESVEITRLSSESRDVQKEISALYEQIGRVYCEDDAKNADALAALCARVAELQERLDALDRQKMQLRNQNRCPACGAVMAKNARFCSSCGRRLPEDAPDPEPAPSMDDVSYCPECGAMRQGEDRFCNVCGHSFDADAQDAPTEAPAEESAEAPAEETADEAPTDFE